MKCPACKEEIEQGAKKCKHCGSYVRMRRRFWGHVISGLQFCTLIAALVMLYFTWQNSRSIREQLDIQKESLKQLSEQFIEEKRPRIEIILTQVSVEHTDLVLYVDYENTGFADAENLLLCIVLKYQDSPADTIVMPCTRMTKISAARKQSHKWPFSGLRASDLTCLIEARYTWSMRDLDYTDEKYFRLPYDSERKQYGRYLLTEEQIQTLWK